MIEVRNWGGGLREFRLLELSRWIVARVWILWLCTGYLYPDGHVSLQIWTRANRIIWWADRAQVSWLCIAEIAAKRSFEIVLEYSRRQGFGSESLMRWKWKSFSPRGSWLVGWKDRLNIMRVYGVFIHGYGAIERSSNRSAPQIVVFTLGSFGRR